MLQPGLTVLGLRPWYSRLPDCPYHQICIPLQVEAVLIRKALSRFEGNVKQAAGALGLSRSGLYRRLAKYGLAASD